MFLGKRGVLHLGFILLVIFALLIAGYFLLNSSSSEEANLVGQPVRNTFDEKAAGSSNERYTNELSGTESIIKYGDKIALDFRWYRPWWHLGEVTVHAYVSASHKTSPSTVTPNLWPLEANRKWIKEWEVFTILDENGDASGEYIESGDLFTLRSHKNKYVSLQEELDAGDAIVRLLYHNSDSIGNTELFKIYGLAGKDLSWGQVIKDSDKIKIYVPENGRYWSSLRGVNVATLSLKKGKSFPIELTDGKTYEKPQELMTVVKLS